MRSLGLPHKVCELADLFVVSMFTGKGREGSWRCNGVVAIGCGGLLCKNVQIGMGSSLGLEDGRVVYFSLLCIFLCHFLLVVLR